MHLSWARRATAPSSNDSGAHFSDHLSYHKHPPFFIFANRTAPLPPKGSKRDGSASPKIPKRDGSASPTIPKRDGSASPSAVEIKPTNPPVEPQLPTTALWAQLKGTASLGGSGNLLAGVNKTRRPSPTTSNAAEDPQKSPAVQGRPSCTQAFLQSKDPQKSPKAEGTEAPESAPKVMLRAPDLQAAVNAVQVQVLTAQNQPCQDPSTVTTPAPSGPSTAAAGTQPASVTVTSQLLTGIPQTGPVNQPPPVNQPSPVRMVPLPEVAKPARSPPHAAQGLHSRSATPPLGPLPSASQLQTSGVKLVIANSSLPGHSGSPVGTEHMSPRPTPPPSTERLSPRPAPASPTLVRRLVPPS